jgi:hypothetical protein
MTTNKDRGSTPLARRVQVLAAGTWQEIEGLVSVLGFSLTATEILARLGEPERRYQAVPAAPTPEAQAEALATYRGSLGA